MTSLAFSPRVRPIPPVSTRVKGLPCHSPSAVTRSRVTPGWSWTIAIRLPTMRLNKADLPTLGRPTIAINPDISPQDEDATALGKDKTVKRGSDSGGLPEIPHDGAGSFRRVGKSCKA